MIEQELYEQFSGASKGHSTVSTTPTESKVKRAFRSAGAVFAGLIATIVLSLGSDVLMHATEIYPPWGEPMSDSQFSIATVYRAVFGVAGSYIAARLSPFQPMEHALALGVIGFILALVGLIATWNAGPEYGRKWYPITLVLISIPCAWLGGKLHTRRASK